MASIYDRFPYKTVREQQKQILDFIIENEDKKIFLINAPTGVGKSGIGITLAKHYGRTWILTDSKALQDQYEGEFPKDTAILKGKNSYKCNINNAFRVDNAPCVGHKETENKCKSNSFCAYFNARDKAFNHGIAVTNYNYLFGFSEILSSERERRVVICDEGHVIEDKLIEHASFEIRPKVLNDRYGIDVDPDLNFLDFDSVVDVCNHIVKCIAIKIKKIDDELERIQNETVGEPTRKTVNPKEAALHREVAALRNHSKKIWNYIDTFDSDWITDLVDDGKALSVTPLKADNLFYNMFIERICPDPMGKIIIMSASLGDFDTMINELNLDRDQTACIDVDTPFDPEKSPVIVMPYLKLGYRDFNNSKHELTNTVDDILEMHKNEKGIIHSGNYKVAEHLSLTSKYKNRFIFKKSGEFTPNGDLFLLHAMSDKPSVLLSPSMHTGIDLKNDLARFQIIAKLPFANMKDSRVKAKMDDDPLWYSNQTWQRIIQSCGRATRSEDDYAVTYILDHAAKMQYARFKKHLPVWFKKRVEFI